MDGLKTGCPDDMTLEAYLYEDLPYLPKTRVRVHLMFCPSCRERLADLRDFTAMLSEIPLEEPPAGFLEGLVKDVDNWGDPTPAAAEDEDEQESVHLPSLRLRWALGALMFIVSSVVQWQYGEYLPGYLSGSYLTGIKGLGQVWDFIRTGAFWRNTLQVIEAVRTDGLSALEILGTSIPTQIAGVVVFGGIVTAVFISQLKASRTRREGHHR